MNDSNFCIVMSTLTLIWLDVHNIPHAQAGWFSVFLATVSVGWVALAVFLRIAENKNAALDAELARLRARKAELEKELNLQ